MRSCIGIDMTSRGVKVAHILRRRDKLVVLHTSRKDVNAQESPSESAQADALLASAIVEANIGANVPLVVGLPYGKVFFSSFRTKLARREDVRRSLRFELEDDFPVRFDDLVTDICGCRTTPERQHEYLVAAVSREQMNECLEEIHESGRKVTVLSTDVCALHAVMQEACPDESGPLIILHADGQRMILAATENGNLVYARHVTCAETGTAVLAREIELARRSEFGGQCQRHPKILLSGPNELIEGLSGPLSSMTECEVRRADLWPQRQSSEDPELGGQYDIALGYALIGLGIGGGLNFLTADVSRADRTAKSEAKYAAIVFSALLAAILGLLGFRSLRGLKELEAERADLERTIRTVFTEAFPKEKKIVNELAQMSEYVNTLRKERDTLVAAVGQQVRPLWVLHVLSERMTSEKEIGISSVSIKDTAVHLTGTARSFESVEQFLDELRQVSEFASVVLEDVALTRGSERPAFRLTISVKTG
jgi:type II secretory pathway component PulL